MQASELLSCLIRNACVNDGSAASGEEVRNVDVLEPFLDGCGIDFVRFEPQPGRVSLVGRVPGRDRAATSLCLMAHVDVVPADPQRWRHDPFGGEVHDGVVWGRGAVDMLNQAAAQATAVRNLLTDGWRPGGDLVLFFPADEEAGGVWGARWIFDHAPDVLRCDYLLTEGGGFVLPAFGPGASDLTIGVAVGEKGPWWKNLRFSGTPGHASIPYGSDNALVKAARVVARLAEYVPEPMLDDVWTDLVDAMQLPDDLKILLSEPATVAAGLERLGVDHPAEARVLYSCCHNTFSTNVMEAGRKLNVIASDATLGLDARVLPGVDEVAMMAELRRALGDLFDEMTVEHIAADPATRSPTGTPLWDVLSAAACDVIGPCRLAPWIVPFATDARFFRTHGTVAYGFTLHDATLDMATWLRLFHGDDERVSEVALANAVAVYEGVLRRFL